MGELDKPATGLLQVLSANKFKGLRVPGLALVWIVAVVLVCRGTSRFFSAAVNSITTEELLQLVHWR